MKTENCFEFELACKTDANVLITGPTGTGKTRLAREIHQGGRRFAGPFVSINLATLHEGILESELFGHERGSFTGADQKRVGKIETAQGGTVFLDEIGELSLRLQSRLLDFLQYKTVTPVGSNRVVNVNVRIIAATNKDLEKEVAAGRFREDLFHRLRLITIEKRALIERSEGFEVFIAQCLRELGSGTDLAIPSITPEVIAWITRYNWPGNFRELKSVLEFATLASGGGPLGTEHLPRWFLADVERFENETRTPSTHTPMGEISILATADYHHAISTFERVFLTRALERYRGRINLTARKTGINKTTLLRRIRALGLAQKDVSHSDL